MPLDYPQGVEEIEFGGRRIIKVKLTQDILVLAREKSGRMLLHYKRDFSATEAEKNNNSFNGLVGEVAFDFLIGGSTWKEIVKAIPEGRPDDGDFAYKGHRGDVKSAALPSPPKLLVTVSDFEHKQCDLYPLVWVRWELGEFGEAWILGWAWMSEVAKAPIYHKPPKPPAYALNFEQLHEPREALDISFKKTSVFRLKSRLNKAEWSK